MYLMSRALSSKDPPCLFCGKSAWQSPQGYQQHDYLDTLGYNMQEFISLCICSLAKPITCQKSRISECENSQNQVVCLYSSQIED